jgi:hypothetical protein
MMDNMASSYTKKNKVGFYAQIEVPTRYVND